MKKQIHVVSFGIDSDINLQKERLLKIAQKKNSWFLIEERFGYLR